MAENKPPVQDRTMWLQDLAYMPTEYKLSRTWMAQSLVWAKKNYQRLLSPLKAIEYRRLNLGMLDTPLYKNLIDPPTTKEKGGEAKYFSADFKDFPIDAHLDNILDAEIRTIPNRLTCTLADPVAKLKEQKDKEKIINQRFVRNIINDFAQELGMPPIGESVDPYKWIQNFTRKKGEEKIDEVGGAIDQIKNRIKDDDGLRMFQQYLYKNGLETAFEIGIKYYLLDQNEFQTKFSDDFFMDLKNFNRFAGRWAINETTGQGEIRYYDPVELYTAPFRQRNGDDNTGWFYEEDISFAEFEKLVGSSLDDEDRRNILELQKSQGWPVGDIDGNNHISFSKNNGMVRLGFFSVLTQEANAYSKKYWNDTTFTFDNRPLTWLPDNTDEEKEAKVYNVWYTCYYFPYNIYNHNANSAADYTLQSKYIFKIRKEIDMMRFGVDQRYAKSSLVLWRDNKRQSWTDIKEAFMPKIRTLWHKIQNCIVNDVQGIVYDADLLAGMLNAVDESNKDGKGGGTAVVNEWKMLKQAGQAWLKFRNKNGELMIEDPSKLFVPIDNGMMKKAEVYLLAIMNLYNLLTQALAKGQATEGLQPEARTPLGGIEIAKAAANKATYFIEESYIDGVIVQFAYRAAHHIHTIAKEQKDFNYKKRWQQFIDVIGSYNAAEIESISEVQFGNIGLTIANKNDAEKREVLIQTTVQKYTAKQISAAVLGLILGTENWKLQIVELSLEEEKQREYAELQAQAEHQRQMELGKQQLEIAQALQQVKDAGKNQNIQTQGQVDAQLAQLENQVKAVTMQQQKEQLLNNKLIENEQKDALNKENETHKANLEAQKSLLAV